jgi:outer membrane lipoprotein-sorting protein
VRILLALLPVLLLAAPSQTGAENRREIFAQMQDRLLRSPVLRADFHQERVLRILRRPLISSGRMVLSEGQGVLWRVEDPHRVTYLIRPAEVLEWEVGTGPRRVGMAAVPGFRLLTEMFLAALTGDLSGLEEAFDAETLPTESGWHVRLTPKAEALSQFISHLEMAGDRYVEAVRLAEAGGDAMNFTFSHFQTDPARLDAAEERYFAH